MTEVGEIAIAMIAFSNGNIHDINHFLKVWSFARIIGQTEGLSSEELRLLEIAAITHDIACPLCRRKYGSAYGKKQELEGPPLAREFLATFNLDAALVDRVVFLIGHHHTYAGVDSLDWQILLEADYLVNADESGNSRKGITSFRNRVFKTGKGRELLDSMYLR